MNVAIHASPIGFARISKQDAHGIAHQLRQVAQCVGHGAVSMQPREIRKKNLQCMPREAIVEAWQKVMASANSKPPKSDPQLIDEIVAKEFPNLQPASHLRKPNLP